MINRIVRRRLLVGALGLSVALTGRPKLIFAGSQTLHDIEIKRFEFNPSILEVRPGDQIRWTSRDISPHTATADDGSWDTGELIKGQSATVKVAENMSTAYLCAFHPNMRAQLIVL
ncbi:MAG: plastocyanin/azurin family copper-binding protein [Geminicoccaceae bacterium]